MERSILLTRKETLQNGINQLLSAAVVLQPINRIAMGRTAGLNLMVDPIYSWSLKLVTAEHFIQVAELSFQRAKKSLISR